MSGAARGASDVIDVMGSDSGTAGAGRRRSQRKRVKTTRAMELMRQEDDMEWEEDNGSESAQRNHKNSTTRAAAADEVSVTVRGPEQPVDRDFNKKLDIMKAEFQLEFRKLRERMAEEVAKMTAQLAQELSQAREELTQARSELEHTRLQLHAMAGAQGAPSARPAYADVARRTPPVSIPTPASSTGRAATPEPAFCTVDMSRVPEEHANEATPVALRKLVELEMRAPGGQPTWRCVAVTRDGGNTNRLRIIGRNEGELKKIKDIVEAKKAPGARVLRDQLYPVKVDNVSRMAVLGHEGKVLPGATEALGAENDVQIAKMAWLSRKDSAKAYGSMVVYVTKAGDARRLLNEGFFYAGGESGYTGVFERRMRPDQCYNCQQIGHKAFQCRNPQVCARCAKEGHHHGNCGEVVASCVLCGGPHESFSRNCRKLYPSQHE
jgi:hypothetical protein